VGGPQSGCGRNSEEDKPHHCHCQEFNRGCPVRSPVSVLTELSELLIPSSKLELKLENVDTF